MKKINLLLIVALMFFGGCSSEKEKPASLVLSDGLVIGDSIARGVGVYGDLPGVTGYTWQNTGQDGWPAYKILNENYWRLWLNTANPKTVLVIAGTNDIKKYNADDIKNVFLYMITDLENRKIKGIFFNINIFGSESGYILNEIEIDRINAINAWWDVEIIKHPTMKLIDFATWADNHPELLRDTCHPNEEGYKQLAGLIIDML